MTDKPILFSGEMVRAILEGLKTQTRRVVNPQPWMEATHCETYHDSRTGGTGVCFFQNNLAIGDANVLSPYGHSGDCIWVRENGWERPDRTMRMMRAGADTWPRYQYDADNCDHAQLKAWGWKRRPSIHMPRWASRITLEIVKVRVERVQDISAISALAEGIADTSYWKPNYVSFRPFDEMWWDDFYFWEHYPQIAFHALWDSINSKRGFGWDVNPWVWVIEFKMVTL